MRYFRPVSVHNHISRIDHELLFDRSFNICEAYFVTGWASIPLICHNRMLQFFAVPCKFRRFPCHGGVFSIHFRYRERQVRRHGIVYHNLISSPSSNTKLVSRVNCSFYFKIGACRHGDRCSRIHNKPTFSQVRFSQTRLSLIPVKILNIYLFTDDPTSKSVRKSSKFGQIRRWISLYVTKMSIHPNIFFIALLSLKFIWLFCF